MNIMTSGQSQRQPALELISAAELCMRAATFAASSHPTFCNAEDIKGPGQGLPGRPNALCAKSRGQAYMLGHLSPASTGRSTGQSNNQRRPAHVMARSRIRQAVGNFR